MYDLDDVINYLLMMDKDDYADKVSSLVGDANATLRVYNLLQQELADMVDDNE